MSHLCGPAPGPPDQEEPRRVLAGCRLPLLNLPTRRYRPRSNKVATKGGGIRFTHPRGPVEGGRALIMQPTSNKTHRELLAEENVYIYISQEASAAAFKGIVSCFLMFHWTSGSEAKHPPHKT